MPNNFQPHIPDFQRGERLSAARLNELADAIARLLWHKQQSANAAFGVRPPLEIIGKLDDDLPAASAFATSPGEAVMTVWIKDAATGNLIETDRKENIKQRFESAEEKAAGDEVRAAWIEGEWVALPGGGGSSRWGLVTASLGCGWYTVELGTLDGVAEASGSGPTCDPCGAVSGAGTSGCDMTIEYPAPRVTGIGISVTAYDPTSTLIPLRAGSDCVVTRMQGAEPSPSGSGSGSATQTWAVRGMQEHIVQFKERWDCCDPDGPPVLVGKTPIVFVGRECDEILCEECPA